MFAEYINSPRLYVCMYKIHGNDLERLTDLAQSSRDNTDLQMARLCSQTLIKTK